MGVAVVEENNFYKFLNPPGTTADTEYYFEQKNPSEPVQQGQRWRNGRAGWLDFILLIQWRRIFSKIEQIFANNVRTHHCVFILYWMAL